MDNENRNGNKQAQPQIEERKVDDRRVADMIMLGGDNIGSQALAEKL